MLSQHLAIDACRCVSLFKHQTSFFRFNGPPLVRACSGPQARHPELRAQSVLHWFRIERTTPLRGKQRRRHTHARSSEAAPPTESSRTRRVPRALHILGSASRRHAATPHRQRAARGSALPTATADHTGQHHTHARSRAAARAGDRSTPPAEQRSHTSQAARVTRDTQQQQEQHHAATA